MEKIEAAKKNKMWDRKEENTNISLHISYDFKDAMIKNKNVKNVLRVSVHHNKRNI